MSTTMMYKRQQKLNPNRILIKQGAGRNPMVKTNLELEHNIRKMLFSHIEQYPGVMFSVLKRVYNLNDSTLRYHLKYLERAERIRPQLVNGKLQYYANNSGNGTGTPDNSFSRYNLNPHQEQILRTIKNNPLLNQTELIAKTSLKRHILTYNLQKLIEMGLIRKISYQRNVCYEYVTNGLIQNEILKVLAVKLLNNEIDEQTFLKLKNRLK